MITFWVVLSGIAAMAGSFIVLSAATVPGILRRTWQRSGKPLVLTLAVGGGLLSMAAITQTDLTRQVFGILPTANGGTGIAFFTAAGPTAARVFTFPDAAATVLTSNAAVTVPQGGTGAGTFTAHGVMLGEGTSTLAATALGGGGTCFMGNASADPSFQTCPTAANDYQEVPSGSINGSNVTFTLAHTPGAATNVNCFLNGLQQRQGAGLDYTISGATITYLTAPPTGYTLNCLYF